MKALRNALNEVYPGVERAKVEKDERYVVEVFDPVKRVGRRLYRDHWSVLRPTDFRIGQMSYTEVIPKRFPKQPTYQLKRAIKFAAWCRKMFPNRTFRLRKVGTSNTIAADVL